MQLTARWHANGLPKTRVSDSAGARLHELASGLHGMLVRLGNMLHLLLQLCLFSLSEQLPPLRVNFGSIFQSQSLWTDTVLSRMEE